MGRISAEFEDTMPQYMEKCKIIPSGLHVCQQIPLLFQALFRICDDCREVDRRCVDEMMSSQHFLQQSK